MTTPPNTEQHINDTTQSGMLLIKKYSEFYTHKNTFIPFTAF